MKLVSLEEARQFFPASNGKYPTVKTLKLRIKQGCRGIRLHSVFDGNQYFTSREWAEQFLREQTQQATGVPLKVDTRAAQVQAKKTLKERFGIDV